MSDTSDADDLEAAVGAFLSDAEEVLGEYNQGYMDADAALSMLVDHMEELEDAYDG
ncbi:hypothetical protein ACFO0N_12960 [Halobium salinum]|uniref:Uncharacterized protein n=1 Tax=Halobium salinum TaxID=1364940 RepID=A0ABD5PDE0_9EURY|nr:hypothetical protein [Halobium salinum]